eukprot:TRINITY_DN13024_c0_g1_i1.p1 TRINITY_DN13024_c0_g1~~TRINITY_DN13024_c0_g1_i1.p1  ORF type:complete len:136 (-),score=31.52 TRINITY_DN13024_c0_g1_i1:121-507(-)
MIKHDKGRETAIRLSKSSDSGDSLLQKEQQEAEVQRDELDDIVINEMRKEKNPAKFTLEEDKKSRVQWARIPQSLLSVKISTHLTRTAASKRFKRTSRNQWKSKNNRSGRDQNNKDIRLQKKMKYLLS